MAQQIVYSVIVFCFGASIGSFLNVVVYRLPRGKSLIWPPSHCPHCQHELSMARDNIPILGWFVVRGKCRYCGEPVPSTSMVQGSSTSGSYASPRTTLQ